MCTWDLTDGKCSENTKLQQVHTNIQSYRMPNSHQTRLFCNGYYVEIMVMDPFTLDVLFLLCSKLKPDWISSLHVLRPSKRKENVVLAITTTGTVKVWTLLGNENNYSEPIYENESKQIRCLNALSLRCCAQNQRTVLIVCAKYWQVFDAGDFTVLCSVMSPTGERWLGGDFLTNNKVILWSDEGKGFLYNLPAKSVQPDSYKMVPKYILVGHTAPVFCLAGASVDVDSKFLVSSSEKGVYDEMLAFGICIHFNAFSAIPYLIFEMSNDQIDFENSDVNVGDEYPGYEDLNLTIAQMYQVARMQGATLQGGGWHILHFGNVNKHRKILKAFKCEL